MNLSSVPQYTETRRLRSLSLFLWRKSIGDEGCRALAEKLGRLRQLQALELGPESFDVVEEQLFTKNVELAK